MSKKQKEIHKEKAESSLLGSMLTLISAVGVSTASAWIAYSNIAIDHDMLLPNAVQAERKSIDTGTVGRLSYYVDQQASGRPLVLIHSVNAAASAYEMSPLFNLLRSRRPVYAMDLPGFGFSERSKRVYTPQLYTQAILTFLETQVKEPADVVGLSLGCEFLARASLQNPALFASLALISPTGFSIRAGGDKSSQQARQSGLSNVLYPAFSFPLWSRPFYDIIATRASIRYFLEKSFIGPVSADLVEYDFLSAHQPGAEHAPLHFISGSLFTPQVLDRVYQYVQTPTLVIYDRDGFTSFDRLPGLLASNSHWSATRIIPTLGLPQFEQLHELISVLEAFWQRQ